MKQIVINQWEKVASDDLNQMQLAAFQSLQDDFLYRFFGEIANGVLGGDLAVSYVSALSASVAVGVGFIFDAAQTGNNPKYRMIKATSAIPVTLTAANPSNPRIDRISLSPNFAVTGTASRFVKAGGTGPIALQTVNKTQEMTYTLVVTAGTPSGSPSAPATPAGCMSLATVLVSASTGMSGAGAVTDTRNVLGLAISNSGHNILTGTTFQSQLDATDAWFSKKLFVPVVAPPSTNTFVIISAATHAGRMIQYDTTAVLTGNCFINLPPMGANGGLRFFVNDVKMNFDNSNVALIPDTTDPIMGLNANFTLDSPGKTWEVWCDSTNGWMLK